ncbi:hypothetical protein DBV08_04020 [Rhodococcus sp. KBW08]|nr:hypothetical protein DBV08_04020 [Rhodococcus sp. KBW08]
MAERRHEDAENGYVPTQGVYGVAWTILVRRTLPSMYFVSLINETVDVRSKLIKNELSAGRATVSDLI